MKKKRGLTIKINFSNRWIYFLITLGILAVISVGVYAATSYPLSGAGHLYTEISTCGSNKILKMNSGGTAWTCGDDASGGGASQWTTSGTNIYNSNTGNVGIGTTNPKSKLSVGGDGQSNTGVYGYNSYTGIYGGGSTGVYGLGDSIGIKGESMGRNGIGVKGGGGDYGLYGYSGNVGIYGEGIVGMYGKSYNDAGIVGIGVKGSGKNYDIYGETGKIGQASFVNVGSSPMCWDGNGESLIGSCSGSSIKFKENINNLEIGLDELMRLRPVSFDYKKNYANDTRQIGFIAEEVEKISPLLVRYENREVVDVKYEKLPALNTKAIQEQQKIIEQLKAELCFKDNSYSWC